MNLVDTLGKFARLYPNDQAFVEVRPLSGKRIELSWAELDERTNRFADSLMNEGIRKGEKIFLLARNSIQWLEAYFAIQKTGAWVTPLNFRFTDEDILYCAKVVEPTAFIFDSEYADRITKLRRDLPTVKYLSCIAADGAAGIEVENVESLIRRGSPLPCKTEHKAEDECAVYFTSGTTGAPKAVLLQNKNVMCIAATESFNHSYIHSDRFLMMPPMYHLAIGHALGAMLAGACTVLLTEQISPKHIIETIARERITVVFLLVPWAMDLLEAFDKGEVRIEDYDLGCWRRTFMGAQPIPPILVRRLKKYFPNMEYDTTYGLSEAGGPGIIHLGVENERKLGAIGWPSLLWNVRIVNDDLEEVKQGEVGEVIVKGAGVMKGYYKNPELTAMVIRDGWLLTGDLGRMDEEGFIYLVDRKKDLIISGGENIFPGEIEGVMQNHPKVHDAAVIGSPDERLGEIITAVIQSKSEEILTEEEIKDFCEQHLPRYKRPRRIIFSEIPRTLTGKVQKHKLRERFAKKSTDV